MTEAIKVKINGKEIYMPLETLLSTGMTKRWHNTMTEFIAPNKPSHNDKQQNTPMPAGM